MKSKKELTDSDEDKCVGCGSEVEHVPFLIINKKGYVEKAGSVCYACHKKEKMKG